MKQAGKKKLVTKSVKFSVTQARRAELGLEVAALTTELAELLAERESFLTPSKADEKKIQAEITHRSQVVHQGYEYRDVELEPVPDFTAGLMNYTDPETGEVLDSRKLSIDERQTVIEA